MIFVKHATDRVLALLALVLLAPVFAAIALWIVLDSGRPVILRQRRAGKDGRPFRMLKFRTMVPDAVEVGRRLGLADPYGLVPDDPRITRSGRFLRRTSLDELPQLVNVLRGEMSLVGPRPDLVEQVANYAEADRRRLAMRPGITGWSQIQGRDEIPWPERFRHDAWYVENWSLRLDAKILLRTFTQLARPDPRPVEDTMNIERTRGSGPVANSTGELTEVEPAAWDALLERLGCGDVYLRRAYVEASCLLDEGRPAFLHVAGAGGDVAFPCIVRPVPDGASSDVTTPYGYGGPVAAGAAPPVDAFWESYERWCAETGVVSTFLRFHPLLENYRYAGRSVRVERLADTIAWSLDEGDDRVVFERMHRHHRRVVRKAEERVDVEAHASPERRDEFASLYEATMRRQNASDFYFFPPAYWDALAARLRDRLVRFDARADGELVGSILCFDSPPWLHYHLGASSEQARSLGAMHLLHYRAACWAKARGARAFHLGGGVGGREDSLWEYKRRFAPDGRRAAWIGKMVHDERAYRALTGTQALELDGFFPAYRRAAAPLALAGRQPSG